MGGEDGPADVAVGGHGGQLPPGGNNGKSQKARIIRVPFMFANDTSLSFSSDLVCTHTGLLQTHHVVYKHRLQSVTGWRLHP